MLQTMGRLFQSFHGSLCRTRVAMYVRISPAVGCHLFRLKSSSPGLRRSRVRVPFSFSFSLSNALAAGPREECSENRRTSPRSHRRSRGSCKRFRLGFLVFFCSSFSSLIFWYWAVDLGLGEQFVDRVSIIDLFFFFFSFWLSRR